jgi:hypothetical protein
MRLHRMHRISPAQPGRTRPRLRVGPFRANGIEPHSGASAIAEWLRMTTPWPACRPSVSGKIIVLKDGVVAEEGNNDELIARGGVYAELHRIQFDAASPSGVVH